MLVTHTCVTNIQHFSFIHSFHYVFTFVGTFHQKICSQAIVYMLGEVGVVPSTIAIRSPMMQNQSDESAPLSPNIGIQFLYRNIKRSKDTNLSNNSLKKLNSCRIFVLGHKMTVTRFNSHQAEKKLLLLGAHDLN